MKTETLMMVRVYLTESEHNARQLLAMLRDEGVRGATLLRGVSGFGQSGKWHSADWADVIGDLPLILEVVDSADKVQKVLPKLLRQTKPRHVYCFPVEAVLSD